MPGLRKSRHLTAPAPPRTIPLEAISRDSEASFKFREFKNCRLTYSLHYHPEYEITFILKGRGMRFVADSIENFEAGDLVLMGPRVPHTWYSKEPAHWLVLQWTPDFAGEDFFKRPEMRRVRRLLELSRSGVRATGKLQREVAAKILEMRRSPRGSWQQFLGLLSALSVMAQGRDRSILGSPSFEPSLDGHMHEKIDAIFHYIRQTPKSIPSQADAAARVRLSPQSFSRLFRRSTGKTYVRYMNELRIGLASRSLLQTEKTITEIAYESGFDSLSNFNALFRKFKHMTPRAYRRCSGMGPTTEVLNVDEPKR
jgi:AraC-like DNA-binding protein